MKNWTVLAASCALAALASDRVCAQATEPTPPALATPAVPDASASPPRAQVEVTGPSGADQSSPAHATDSGAPAPPAGPVIELPPDAEPEAGAPAAHDEPSVQLGVAAEDSTLSRGLGPARMAQRHTVVGGYGQFGLNVKRAGASGEFDSQASVRRLVLFVAHPITDDIRIYTEFEWENALACSSCAGSAEVEQAFVQWRLWGDALALRAGLVLVPMGIINQWHEPPVFHGVERPMVDQVIIPTTWRELALGFTGSYAEQLRYELYLTTTLDPTKLTQTGLPGASSLGSLSRAKAFAVTGRIEIEPLLGFITGASFFASNLGPNADYYDANGRSRDHQLPLLGYALDARIRRAGFEARAVWTQFFLPNSEVLLRAFDKQGGPLLAGLAAANAKGSIPKRIQGGYLELAYNVFALTRLSHELLGFVRLELYDTQAAVPAGESKDPALDVQELTAGLTYRPIPQLVFKTDLQLRDVRLGKDTLQWNLGFGYMF